MQQELPKDWTTGLVAKLPKIGGLRQCNN